MRRALLVTYIRIFVYLYVFLYVHSYTLFGCIHLTIFIDVYKHS